MEPVSFTVENIHTVAKKILEELPAFSKKSTLLTLSGDLGSGKTTLVQHIATILNIKEVVTSPTFVIRKDYLLVNQKWSHVIHIDMYRVGFGENVSLLGLKELLEKPNFLVIIEWPEKIVSSLPIEQLYSYRLSIVSEEVRTIEKV